MVVASDRMQKYFTSIEDGVKKQFDLANNARKKGFDPTDKVDVAIAKNLAERVVGLISVVCPEIAKTGVVDRIIELEKQFGTLDWRVAMQIALEIAQNKFVPFKKKIEGIEVGIRVGFAYVTVGVVSSPLEGFTKIELKKRRDNGKEYFAMNFAGPVRNAGGTAAATSVIIADYVRKHLGYAKYDPDEKEQERCYTEIMDYHERVTNLQYVPSKEESLFMCKMCPIEIDGDPSERFEVSNFKDLPRIKANRIRSGFCLIHSSCLPLKAKKLWKQVSKWYEDMGMQDWLFLKEFLDIQQKATSKSEDKVEDKEQSLEEKHVYPNYTYVADLVGGRPVIGHPIRPGGFRLRYGRSRVSGFSAQSVHPATMFVLDNFLANATQLKVERPGKAAAYTSCDTIEGPIVKLDNGDVIKILTVTQAKELQPRITEILYLGDVLINYGDFLDRAHTLLKPGYCEEWWARELEAILGDNPAQKLEEKTGITQQKAQTLFTKTQYVISFASAIKISEETNIALHPQFTFFWKLLTIQQFQHLLKSLVEGNVGETITIRNGSAKQSLEVLGIPHVMSQNEYITIKDDFAKALIYTLKIKTATDANSLLQQFNIFKQEYTKPDVVLAFLNSLHSIEIKDKAGVFIGSRMGRPEKAKMRKIAGNVYGVPPQKHQIRNVKTNEVTTKIITEHNLKKQLREKFDVYANKDGSVRYDGSEVPITHFKPKEVGASVVQLKKLGYTCDIHNQELTRDDQILELFPQDIVIPCCTESPFEPADEVMFRVAAFVDEELKQLYGMDPFYNLKTKSDLIGQLVFALAPHTSAASVGRIVGFTQNQGIYCHPMMHAAMRRDCDGDETCFFLLFDGFLNFSTQYLPQHRGGTMDAPLVLTSIINPSEVDDMVFNLDIAWQYPLEFYQACCEYKKPWDVQIPIFEKNLGTNKQFEGMGFTHDTANFNDGVKCSAYKLLPSMKEKVAGQMRLAEKIRAVDEAAVAQTVIQKHFLRDTMGNLRKFSMQEFRCVKCNTKFRRPPISGRCTTCNASRIIFTISKGSVVKYLELSKQLSTDYAVDEYIRHVIDALQNRVDGVFGKEKEQQSALDSFFT